MKVAPLMGSLLFFMTSERSSLRLFIFYENENNMDFSRICLGFVDHHLPTLLFVHIIIWIFLGVVGKSTEII